MTDKAACPVPNARDRRLIDAAYEMNLHFSQTHVDYARIVAAVDGPPNDECLSCGEVGEHDADGQCSQAKRPCGHHCNCVWVHCECHWCGQRFGEDECSHPADAVMWNEWNEVTQCHRCGQVMGVCHYCGPTDRELRPYGPGGASICFKCGTATSEREAGMGANYGALLDANEAISPSGATVLTNVGPVPFDIADLTGQDSTDSSVSP